MKKLIVGVSLVLATFSMGFAALAAEEVLDDGDGKKSKSLLKKSEEINVEGAFGFGVGVDTAAVALIRLAPSVTMKYWFRERIVLKPGLRLGVSAAIDDFNTNTDFVLSPSLILAYSLIKGKATRLNAGGGLALDIGVSKQGSADADTQFGFGIPVELEVEHFFARWISAGLGTGFQLLSYSKVGDTHNVGFDINTARFFGTITFYTD